MPRYPITITVTEMHHDKYPPKCPVHELGDTFTVNNGCVEGKMCLPALAQHIARIYGLCNGMPSTRGEVFNIPCPDHGKVIFELRRDPTKWWKDPLSPLTDAEVRPG
jgi:uncharacterized repeat protein (TIGR04076 family)